VEGRIDVPGMQHAAVWTGPGTVGQRQGFVLEAAGMAQLRGWVETVYHHDRHAIPLTAVLQLSAYHAHGCIVERLRQLGSRKASDVQVFDADRLVILNELRREVVHEVRTLVGNALVDACDPGPCPGLVAA